MSELVSIVYKPQDVPESSESYTRVPLQQARLVVGGGIDGDLKGKSAKRQLNIMSAQAVEQLGEEGFLAAPGQLGEQLIVAGLDVNALPIGTRLQIGESACVELLEPRTGCAKFERYQNKSRTEATGRLGMIARVVAEGEIRVGDPVKALEVAAV